MKISVNQFLAYVNGWLSSDAVERDELTINEMNACLHNAKMMLCDDQDGIKAEIKRKKFYASSK